MAQPYTPQEIFWIFKEEHRLCSPLDPIADASFDLTFESKIWEWRDCRDLLDWEDLSKFLNSGFRINISKKEWKKAFEPDDERTIGDVCNLIAQHAIKDALVPIKILGQECLSASLFLTLKKNLKSKGVDVSKLRPSSNVSPYIENYFSPMIEEVTKAGVRVFDTLEFKRIYTERQAKSFWDKIFTKYLTRKEFYTGDVITFRDLILKILKSKQAY